MRLIFEEVSSQDLDTVLQKTIKYYNTLISISQFLDRLYSDNNVKLMKDSSQYQYFNDDIKEALEYISHISGVISKVTDGFSKDFED